jgi:putative pyruvate formate lyase activating enzyme
VTTELGTDTYVNLMAQYHPAGLVGSTHRDSYHEIARQLARDEYELAIEYAHLGLRRLDQRSRAAALQLPTTPAPAGSLPATRQDTRVRPSAP